MSGTSFVYIAGPYRPASGEHDWRVYEEIDRNISHARWWAARLAADGIPYFCPHMNSAHMEVLAPSAPPEFWYNLDMLFLERAWALLLIPGWRGSRGARAERDFARDHKMRIYTEFTYERLVADYRGGEPNAVH